MDFNTKYKLVTRNLQEILGEEDLKKRLKKKDFSIYWGTMPTGSISLAYFFPMLKIADFLKAGIKVKILLADLHAALDGVSWEILEKRYRYYKRLIVLILRTIGVNEKKLEFIKGSSFQLKEDYFKDILKLSTITSVSKAKHSASEAVKSARENPKLAGLIYPLMMALDEEYMGVDAQFSGIDQRKIVVYAREYLPKIGYKQNVEFMNPMIRGLIGEQMSSSIESSKIDLLDNEKEIRKKINKAECVAGDSNNGILALLKYLIMIIKEDKKEKFVVKRDIKYGGNLTYLNYDEIEKDFISKKLHPLDLKNAVSEEINSLLTLIRKDKLIFKLYKEAYK